MSGENFEFKHLQWDTDYFGVSSARVFLNDAIDESGQKRILEQCKDYDFVTFSNRFNNNENNYWINTKTNAFLTDINIQYQKKISDKFFFEDEDTIVLNNVIRDEQIVGIAKKSFKYSRFFNDPNLPREQAIAIYLHWTISAFEQESKFFVIYKNMGKTVGFLLFSLNKDESIIELIAVDEEYKGKKIGYKLIRTMESYVANREIYMIKVGTQLNNISANRFYTSLGFNYVESSSIYHLWKKRQEV